MRKWISTGMVFLTVAGPALAGSETGMEAVLSHIRDQGYRVETLERTWLGRVRIKSVGPRGERETVFNPHTGEIMRDLLVAGPSAGVQNSNEDENEGDDGDDGDEGVSGDEGGGDEGDDGGGDGGEGGGEDGGDDGEGGGEDGGDGGEGDD